ncbi:MAG: peptidoglycan-binding domain-containing protein [Minisyncoccia bacterium]
MKNIKIVVVFAAIFGLFVSVASVHAAVPYITSAKITGPNVVTIIFSESVMTGPGDYGNFAGAFAGKNLISALGAGTNTITLTFDGSAFPPGGTGTITIGTGVRSVSDNSYYAGANYGIANGQPPILSSYSYSFNNINNVFGGVGNSILLTFNTNEQVANPIVSILGHSLYVNGGSGMGPFTVSYTVANGDSIGTIPVSISLTDTNGNANTFNMSVSGNGSSVSSGSVNMGGYITSSANSAGVLNAGDSILFTLYMSTTQPNARVAGSYNGVPLSWNTSNGGSSFTALYTVASGQTSQASPLQISGVTITNQYGVVSAPISGYDVQKTINASAPTYSSSIKIYTATTMPSQTSPTPSYSFVSNAAGTIRYTGDCSSQTTNAISGTNTITFNTLANGYHGNCAIAVADYYGNLSNVLAVPPFTVSGSSASVTAPTTSVSSSDLTAQLQALQDQLNKLQKPTSVSTNSSYQFLNPLKLGSSGTDVTELQKKLKSEGVYSGAITGYFGSLTETAVKKYQKTNGLTQLGSVGPGTRALLNK